MASLSSRAGRFGVAGAVTVVFVAFAAVGSPASHGAAAATISSVTVSGSPARPVVTVTGTGLTVPKPNPQVSPSGQPLCPLQIKGNAGFDYGTRLYLVAFSTAPDKFIWSAGRYRAGLKELDCIGIVVLSQAPTRVQFTFGNAYRQYRSQYPPLVNGDLAEVVLNGAAFGFAVHYR